MSVQRAAMSKRQRGTRDLATSSRLAQLFHNGPAQATSAGNGLSLRPIHSNPNIYLVDNFLSPADLDHIDHLLTSRRATFKPSHIDDDKGNKNYSQQRTSETLVLGKGTDAVLRGIERRAAELVCLPPDQAEPLQVVSYTDGQKFDFHHDLGVLEESDQGCDANGTRAPGLSVTVGQGPERLVTFFIYLNSLPRGVGSTNFPLLSLSVQPKCGSALIFCNVLANGMPDVSVSHCAMPVPNGHRKLGCNLWITDSTMIAHTLARAPCRTKHHSSATGKQNALGVLGALLAEEVYIINTPSPSAIIGVSFLMRHGGHASRSGRVVSHDVVKGYHVKWANGGSSYFLLDSLVKLPLSNSSELVGRRVSKYFPGHGRFEGKVTSFEELSGFFSVRYIDGDVEELVAEELLRVLGNPSQRRRKRSVSLQVSHKTGKTCTRRR